MKLITIKLNYIIRIKHLLRLRTGDAVDDVCLYIFADHNNKSILYEIQ